MKTLMNIATNAYDMDQYRDETDLQRQIHSLGFDGVELLLLEDNTAGKLRPEHVIGVHLPFVNCWVDFWKQDHARLLQEYQNPKWIKHYFGGDCKSDFTAKMIQSVQFASRFCPEYLVYHVAECTARESVTRQYHYSGYEVIDQTADFVNTWADYIDGTGDGIPENKTPVLLFENLWHSGLNLSDPDQIPRLLSQIDYPRKGIMLDTGHLLHTNPGIRTSDDAVDYIHEVLDRQKDLTPIRGIHLHHTLSGEVAAKIQEEEARRSPDFLQNGDYTEKLNHYYPLIYQIDRHEPFTSPRVKEIIERIHPEYLVFELIYENREHYAKLAEMQWGYVNCVTKS